MKGIGAFVAVAAMALLSSAPVGQAAAQNAAAMQDALAADAAAEPGPAGPMSDFDCIMEPKLTIKLGTADTGIIDQVKVDRGDVVHAGEIVATLDSQLQRLTLRMARLKAGSDVDVQSEQARLAYRKTAAQRNEALHQKDFVSTKAYDEAMVEMQLAQYAVQKAQNDHQLAQEQLAEAEARLDRRSIRTPIDGIVVDVTSKPGEYVYEQTPVMTIANIDPLYVKVFVPVRYYGKLSVGTQADVMPQQPVGGIHRARVSVIDHVFDAASSTFGVRLVLPNPKFALPAGLRCKVHFLTKEAAR
jgi:RND family efflux transporter MFP subunit